MNPRQIFEQWAPPESPWTTWAKPALFINLPITAPMTTQNHWQTVKVTAIPPANGTTALIIDIPGDEATRLGLALARQGYRPVPLYNCCSMPNEIVSTTAIRTLLDHGANDLQQIRLPPNAPPAFLLDSQRLRPAKTPGPGDFDNRWIVLPQDLPSGTFLKNNKITHIVLIQDIARTPSEDLAHILLRWKEAELEIMEHHRSEPEKKPTPLHIPKPRHFRTLWHTMLTLMGFRRNSAGGFGSYIPQPSANSGYRGYG